MTAGLLLAVSAALGVHLLSTALLDGRRDLAVGPARTARPGAATQLRTELRRRAERVGLDEVDARELVATAALAGGVAALVGLVIFGALLPALVMALAGAAMPVASCRIRRQQRLAAAHEAWPQLVEQIRMATAELGRSVPQALFEAGRSGPAELRRAFDEAQREWLLSTDFERTVAVLKRRLADATADAACETLLVAHQVGGADLDSRLRALVEDRILDVQSRKDARSRQAGVRFARRFVLLVPCGMALAGLTIGAGRAAYQTSWGQAMVTAGVLSVALCWLWAGRLLKLPPDERVFDT